jgi:crotonobetainyl-CoA:carnitine CoA-transferase CaiB-like acyl-CoA transferase
VTEPAHGPLHGVKVLDLTRVAAGPFSTMMLADLGADVVKVERPRTGDDTRAMDVSFKAGESGYFLGLNKNKRSIVIDFKDEDDMALLRRLFAWADVVVENFRLGVPERLGVGYEDVKAVNPSVVYCSITGFGSKGRLKDRAAYDIIAQAMGGIMAITGDADRAPAKSGTPIADLAAGSFATSAILAALYHRERTGEGQKVETSLLGGVLALQASYVTSHAMGTRFERVGSAHNTLAPYQAFQGSDDEWFILAVGNESFWGKAMRAMGRADLGEAEEWATNAQRTRRRDELAGILQADFRAEPAEHWLKAFDAAGVPASPIMGFGDIVDEPHFRDAGYLVDVEHPSVGAFPSVVAPLSFSATPVSVRRPPPLLDQHGAEVREMLVEFEKEAGQ